MLQKMANKMGDVTIFSMPLQASKFLELIFFQLRKCKELSKNGYSIGALGAVVYLGNQPTNLKIRGAGNGITCTVLH